MNQNQKNALKTARAVLAKETLKILEDGYYFTDGKKVDIRQALRFSKNETRIYNPNSFQSGWKNQRIESPKLSISEQTTAEAISDYQGTQICALNFASAKSPGGGFKRGAIAQEEDLAIASGLYSSLETKPSYYKEQKEFPSSLHLDLAIYSPNVPFFRNRDWSFKSVPDTASIITCAAPNRIALQENDSKSLPHVEGALQRRIKLIIEIAQSNNINTLILGAWGCGVFGNDPTQISKLFLEGIREHGKGIPKIHFAVYDPSPEKKTYQAFEYAILNYKP